MAKRSVMCVLCHRAKDATTMEWVFDKTLLGGYVAFPYCKSCYEERTEDGTFMKDLIFEMKRLDMYS